MKWKISKIINRFDHYISESIKREETTEKNVHFVARNWIFTIAVSGIKNLKNKIK